MSLEVAKEKGNSTLVQVIEQYLKLHKSGKFAESSAADSSNTVRLTLLIIIVAF